MYGYYQVLETQCFLSITPDSKSRLICHDNVEGALFVRWTNSSNLHGPFWTKKDNTCLEVGCLICPIILETCDDI